MAMTSGPALDPMEPGWTWDAEAVRRLGEATNQLVLSIMTDAASGVVAPVPPGGLLDSWANDQWPDAGVPVEDVLREFADTVAPFPFGNGHPRFAAWINSPPHPLGVAAAALAAAMNPSVAGGNHAAVHLERRVVGWFANLVGWCDGYTGQFVSGGSASTLTALAVARRGALSRAGHDERRDGLTGIRARLVVYASAEAHSCVTKAVEALGIGSANITRIAVDSEHRIVVADLERTVAADLGQGAVPIAVVASAGTVNTGAVDPIAEIADVCDRHNLWLHVDGAYGGAAVLLLDGWESARSGLARADSVALDPHKWLYVPVDAGLILLRSEAIARDTFSLVPPYLRITGGVDEPVWFSEYGLEQTRPFRALKVWMQLTHLGKDGYRQLLSRDIAVARALSRQVGDSPDLEVLASGLSVVCFRHCPADLPDDCLDAHNEALLHRLQVRGKAFLAGTLVDGRFALRACVVSPHTTTRDTAAILAEVRRCGAIVRGRTGMPPGGSTRGTA
jgi:aromatic-L-amino-acid decarboxylase